MSSSAGGGGKREPKQKNPTFTRVIPKFLQQFSHLLDGSNKKNYLGEELGHDEAPDSFMNETRELAIKAHMDALKADGLYENDGDAADEDKPQVANEDADEARRPRPFSSEEEGLWGRDGATNAAGEEELETEAHQIEEFAGSKGKIVFAQQTKKRERVVPAGDGEAKKKKTTKEKKSLLSFDDSEEAF